MSNPFDWRNHKSAIIDEVRILDRRARSSATLTAQVEKKRKTNPAYGTVFGIGQLHDSIAPQPTRKYK